MCLDKRLGVECLNLELKKNTAGYLLKNSLK